MKLEDEKFLRDIAWSEAWFPWKQKRRAIFVRGGDGKTWEKIAIGLSALALIVSAASAWGTFRQTDLMREQLTADNRNEAFLELQRPLEEVCSALMRIQSDPNRTSKKPDAKEREDFQTKFYAFQDAARKLDMFATSAQERGLDKILLWASAQTTGLEFKSWEATADDVTVCARISYQLTDWFKGKKDLTAISDAFENELAQFIINMPPKGDLAEPDQ